MRNAATLIATLVATRVSSSVLRVYTKSPPPQSPFSASAIYVCVLDGQRDNENIKNTQGDINAMTEGAAAPKIGCIKDATLSLAERGLPEHSTHVPSSSQAHLHSLYRTLPRQFGSVSLSPTPMSLSPVSPVSSSLSLSSLSSPPRGVSECFKSLKSIKSVQ